MIQTDFPSIVGLGAAMLTTASYVPQVRKTWATGETEDLSLKMLIILAAGLTLWAAYGAMRGDFVIIIGNIVSVVLVGAVLYVKLSKR